MPASSVQTVEFDVLRDCVDHEAADRPSITYSAREFPSTRHRSLRNRESAPDPRWGCPLAADRPDPARDLVEGHASGRWIVGRARHDDEVREADDPFRVTPLIQ